ncbi:hypothetical protein ADUPG1_010909, partial [Aduncisulcus paluster]
KWNLDAKDSGPTTLQNTHSNPSLMHEGEKESDESEGEEIDIDQHSPSDIDKALRHVFGPPTIHLPSQWTREAKSKKGTALGHRSRAEDWGVDDDGVCGQFEYESRWSSTPYSPMTSVFVCISGISGGMIQRKIVGNSGWKREGKGTKKHSSQGQNDDTDQTTGDSLLSLLAHHPVSHPDDPKIDDKLYDTSISETSGVPSLSSSSSTHFQFSEPIYSKSQPLYRRLTILDHCCFLVADEPVSCDWSIEEKKALQECDNVFGITHECISSEQAVLHSSLIDHCDIVESQRMEEEIKAEDAQRMWNWNGKRIGMQPKVGSLESFDSQWIRQDGEKKMIDSLSKIIDNGSWLERNIHNMDDIRDKNSFLFRILLNPFISPFHSLSFSYREAFCLSKENFPLVRFYGSPYSRGNLSLPQESCKLMFNLLAYSWSSDSDKVFSPALRLFSELGVRAWSQPCCVRDIFPSMWSMMKEYYRQNRMKLKDTEDSDDEIGPKPPQNQIVLKIDVKSPRIQSRIDRKLSMITLPFGNQHPDTLSDSLSLSVDISLDAALLAIPRLSVCRITRQSVYPLSVPSLGLLSVCYRIIHWVKQIHSQYKRCTRSQYWLYWVYTEGVRLWIDVGLIPTVESRSKTLFLELKDVPITLRHVVDGIVLCGGAILSVVFQIALMSTVDIVPMVSMVKWTQQHVVDGIVLCGGAILSVVFQIALMSTVDIVPMVSMVKWTQQLIPQIEFIPPSSVIISALLYEFFSLNHFSLCAQSCGVFLEYSSSSELINVFCSSIPGYHWRQFIGKMLFYRHNRPLLY